jgi:Replication-relaxation
MALREGRHVGEDSELSPKTFTRRMKVSKQTLAHELMVADVRTAFTFALRERERFELLSFDVWPRRFEFMVNNGQRREPMKPDGHVRFVERQNDEEIESHYFFEADTGSENLALVVQKCLDYREYYRTGGYALFCGGKREEIKSHPFQVLIVCDSEKRRDNLAKKLLETRPPFSAMILITTLAECARDPLGDIWMTALVHKEDGKLCSLCD